MNTPTLTTPIWVVEGSSGEYSDYRSWIVCAYYNEEDAKRHADLAKTRSDTLVAKYPKGGVPVGANEYDPQWGNTYLEGSDYQHYMVELRSMPAT